jgi:hypothetical protein
MVRSISLVDRRLTYKDSGLADQLREALRNNLCLDMSFDGDDIRLIGAFIQQNTALEFYQALF